MNFKATITKPAHETICLTTWKQKCHVVRLII